MPAGSPLSGLPSTNRLNPPSSVRVALLRAVETACAFTGDLPEVAPMRNLSRFTLLLVLAASLPARATVFATVQGVVHDPQHRPIADAAVTLRAADSSFTLRATTDTEG